MKKNKILHKLFYLATLIPLLSSCSSIMKLTSITADIAGATGLVDTETANAISKSASSFSNATEVITPDQEYYVGRAVAANIIDKYKIYNNSELQKYINLICHTITVNSNQSELYKGYFVQILDSNEINAFATSGGHILITKGLIKNTKSEDELAAVLAHEIAHIHLKHSIKSIKTSRYTQALLDSKDLAFIGSDSNTRQLLDMTSDFSNMVEEVTKNMVNIGYSKTNEFDADSLALNLLNDAGYNPYKLIDMLNMIQTKSNTKSGFGKTHPSPASRIENISNKLSIYRDSQISQERIKRFNTYSKTF